MGIRRNGETFEFTIDTDDLQNVIRHKWCRIAFTKSKSGYLASTISGEQVYLHHFLIGKPKKGMKTDHIDRDKTNNRRGNLAHVSSSHNTTNRKITNKHGFPGIYYLPDTISCYKNGSIPPPRHPWHARMRVKDVKSPFKNGNKNGTGSRLLSLGTFKTKEEAIEARKRAEQSFYGKIFHI